MTEEEKAQMTPEEKAEWLKNHPEESSEQEDTPMTDEEKDEEKEIAMM